MTTRLTEDDLYRTSTQYRLWSFSPDQLAAQRRQTHEVALARARQYAQQQNGTSGEYIEYFTEEEERRLVQRYCEIVRVTSTSSFKWPEHVKATAIQYLKRFYLSNSCMTYPPQEIYRTVMFLASKTEALHWSAPKFAAAIAGTTLDMVLAPEYKVMQALRFTLDVRSPFRGLKGVLMELLNMAVARVGDVDGVGKKTGKEVKDSLLALEAPTSSCRTQWRKPSGPLTDKDLKLRIDNAYAAALVMLDGAGSITDAYFLYTPSQIMFAGLMNADEPLTSFYLDTKIPTTSPMRPKILATIQSCAEMLAAYESMAPMTKEERTILEAKLNNCRDPTTRDLVKSHAAMKRNGAEEGKIDEQEVKRRKLQRQKSEKEGEDLFGPVLPTKTNGNG